MTADLDGPADALLVATIARENGDLHAAFVALCACVTIEDVSGESFERALARAVTDLLGRHRHALAAGQAVGDPAPSAPPETAP